MSVYAYVVVFFLLQPAELIIYYLNLSNMCQSCTSITVSRIN